MSLRWPWWVGGVVGAVALGVACGGSGSGDGDEPCPVGSVQCSCTAGGACDPGLVCIEDRCVNADLGTGDDGPVTTQGATGGATLDGTTGSATAPGSSGGPDPDTTLGAASSSEGGGSIFDVGVHDIGVVPTMGCQAIDMLFAIDSSGSMGAERAALSAVGAFTQVITTLEGLNGGGIDYRIGVTSSNDHGFIVPAGWVQPDPWFDAQSLTAMEIASAFNGAVAQLGALGDPLQPGCEHVLTSAVDLVEGDVSGFVRPDALLVLVLLTDVDDYGAYDQQGGNTCGLGCATPPPPLMDLFDALVAVKGAPEGVAAIVVAGDPGVLDGLNFCNQPGSCGCVDVIPGFTDCEIFHATRLYDFTTMLGSNGYAADLCAGAASVPTAVETALTDSIELACQSYEPEG